MNREILRLALPSIISNVTVPLLGLVDLTIVGHIGDAAYISAIATGSMIFNIIYWIFGFLRMGTSGMTAQAYGKKDSKTSKGVLRKGITTGSVLGLTFIILQTPLLLLMIWALNTPNESVTFVRQYFRIVIWGAPAMLSLYALTGWFIGMQDTRTPLAVAIVQNIINIIASIVLVFVVGWKIEGVATGTLIAQWSGLLMAVWNVKSKIQKMGSWREDGYMTIIKTQSRKSTSFFRVNRDIFLRTLCLVAVNLFFTSAGGRQGTLILAVNALLITFYTLFSYVMDGFAYAAEALCGKYYGRGDMVSFRLLIHKLYNWGIVMVIAFTIIYVVGGKTFLGILTSDDNVVNAATDYLPWACAIPFCGVLAFIYDGVFIGITATKGMLASAIIATASFFAVYFSLHHSIDNKALWLAFLIFLAMRGVVQAVWLRLKIRKVR